MKVYTVKLKGYSKMIFLKVNIVPYQQPSNARILHLMANKKTLQLCRNILAYITQEYRIQYLLP